MKSANIFFFQRKICYFLGNFFLIFRVFRSAFGNTYIFLGFGIERPTPIQIFRFSKNAKAFFTAVWYKWPKNGCFGKTVSLGKKDRLGFLYAKISVTNFCFGGGGFQIFRSFHNPIIFSKSISLLNCNFIFLEGRTSQDKRVLKCIYNLTVIWGYLQDGLLTFQKTNFPEFPRDSNL